MTLKLYAVLFLGLFSMGAKCQEVALKVICYTTPLLH